MLPSSTATARDNATPEGAAVLYVGPSLRQTDFTDIDGRIEVRPPIRRGDLPAAVADGRRLLCIVDGEFYQSLAVSPKEILIALQAGCEIIGAASMGALRAAELHPYGMRGVGQIFEWFRSGEVFRDDDVALSYAHDENDYRMLTVPMVNVRWVLRQARQQGMLTPAIRRRISAAARRIYWEQRSWRRICLEAALSRAEARELLDYAKNPSNDLKRIDAIAAVAALEERLPQPAARAEHTAPSERKRFAQP